MIIKPEIIKFKNKLKSKIKKIQKNVNSNRR